MIYYMVTGPTTLYESISPDERLDLFTGIERLYLEGA